MYKYKQKLYFSRNTCNLVMLVINVFSSLVHWIDSSAIKNKPGILFTTRQILTTTWAAGDECVILCMASIQL